MKKSEHIDKLAEALAKAQGQFTAAERDYTAKVQTKKGSEYQFNYADLAAYLDVCRGPLSENGLAVVQEPVADGQKAKVTTFLMHASGQWLEFDPLELCVAFKEPGEIPTPQEMGSLITYARRYSQSAGLNMASESDDDGNAASGNTAQTGKREPNPTCPNCNTNEHVIKGKAEYGGGWLCWKNKGGCGHKWQDQTPADVDAAKKAEADRIAAENGMTTGDKLPPKSKGKKDDALKPPYPTALAAIERLDTVDKAVKLADWCEKEHIARRLEAKDHDDLAIKITDKLFEICQTEADYEAADKLLLAFIGKMRIHDEPGTALRIKLADAKDQKFAGAAA